MGIIVGALGGLGKAASEYADVNQRAWAQQDQARLSADLETQRQQTLLLLQEKIKDAPLERLSARAQEKMAEQVPVTAGQVRNLSGDSGIINGGMTGDYAALVKRADSLPEADRAPYLAQLEQQRTKQQTAADQAAAGKTRSRTSDEAFDAALEDAKINDVAAYRAGKPLAGEKTITVADGATVIDRTGKVLYDGSGTRAAREDAREDRRDERMAIQEEGRDRRQSSMLTAQERLAEIRAGAGSKSGAVNKEERLRYTSLFNEAGRRMSDATRSLNTLRRDPLYSMAKPGTPQASELEGLQAEIQEYKKERSLYGNLLSGGAGEDDPAEAVRSTAPIKAPATPDNGSRTNRPPLSSFQR